MFGDRVVRRVFGSTRDEVTGECRRRHNEEPFSSELLIKHFLGNKIKNNEVDRACGTWHKWETGEVHTGF